MEISFDTLHQRLSEKPNPPGNSIWEPPHDLADWTIPRSTEQTSRQPLVQKVTLVSPSGATLFACEVLTLGELRDNVSIETGIEDPILVTDIWPSRILDHEDDTAVCTVVSKHVSVVVHSWKTITEGV